MHSIGLIAALAAVTATMTATGTAEDLTVVVDSQSFPWNRAANPQFPGGSDDGKPPKMVWAPWKLDGLKIHFKASGQMFIQTELGSSGPEGLSLPPSYGVHEARLPDEYTSNGGGLSRHGSLIGAFVDADGKVIGRPFVIGREYEIVAPKGTIAISLGTDDDRYNDNSGKYTVIISIPAPTVSVEPTAP